MTNRTNERLFFLPNVCFFKTSFILLLLLGSESTMINASSAHVAHKRDFNTILKSRLVKTMRIQKASRKSFLNKNSRMKILKKANIKKNESMDGKKNKIVIGDPTKKETGFCAALNMVINNLMWADKNNVLPVVYWSKEKCLYYEEGAHNGNPNVWEYFFEPLSTARYEEGDKITIHAPDGNFINLVEEECPTLLYNKTLWQARHKVASKYIRVRKYILDKIENFYQKNMQNKITIGIHLRGTDKFIEAHPLNMARFFERINQKAKEFPGCQFLIATDELRMLEMAKQSLNGPVIYYDAYRSLDGKPIHQPLEQTVARDFDNSSLRSDFKYSKALLGEEILIEVLLLSKCNFFFHTCSNIPTAVFQFNPEIEHELIMSDQLAESTKKRIDPNYSSKWDIFLKEQLSPYTKPENESSL